jgi:hypothetical protein
LSTSSLKVIFVVFSCICQSTIYCHLPKWTGWIPLIICQELSSSLSTQCTNALCILPLFYVTDALWCQKCAYNTVYYFDEHHKHTLYFARFQASAVV